MHSDSEPHFSEDEDSTNVRVSKIALQEDLLPLLECPVCFELPLPPIRTCLQGHIICADCCPKLSGCPLCQKPIGFGRNFFAEDFINKAELFCMYREDGCNLSTTGAQFKHHATKCKYRPFKCRYCINRIRYRDLEKHLLIQHRITRWDINDEGVKILHLEKQRRDGNDNVGSYQTSQTVVSTEMLLMSLLAVAVAASLLVVENILPVFHLSFYD